MEFEDYSDIVNGLKKLPITWYPALLILLIEIVIDKKIFNGKIGLMHVINRVIDRKGYK